MEAGGFRVKLDLSLYFNDIKRFSCIYVDPSRDRQIADVTDRISELFEIEHPLFLLDERFYLPETENVNVLRDSKVVKVLRTLHLQDREKCHSTTPLISDAKAAKYLRIESASDKAQTSLKHSSFDILGYCSSYHLEQDGEEPSSSVSLTTKEAPRLHGKKRKLHDFDNSELGDTSENFVQQELEPELYFQKKCKRKKERIKKEQVDGNISEDIKSKKEESERYSSDFQVKHKEKKSRRKIKQVNAEDIESAASSLMPTCNPLDNVSNKTELLTKDARETEKQKKKRKDDISAGLPEENSFLLDSQNSKNSDPVIPNSTHFKKHKKKYKENEMGSDVLEVQSLPPTSKIADSAFMSSCFEAIQNCHALEMTANRVSRNHDSIESDFTNHVVSSTPTHNEGTNTGGTVNLPLHNNLNIPEPSLQNHQNIGCNIALSVKPKRKRVRVRKRKKGNVHVQNDLLLYCKSSCTGDVPPAHPQRKHIRFAEGKGKEETDSRQEDVSPDGNTNTRNKTLWDVNRLHSMDTEHKEEVTQAEVIDCAVEHRLETELDGSTFKQATPQNSDDNDNAGSSAFQAPRHRQWALNPAKVSMDSEESLQKLLSLGKQNSSPVVFERKRPSNNFIPVSAHSTTAMKENKKNAEETERQGSQEINLTDSNHLEADGSLPETNPANINPLNYPRLEGKPKENDIIAFKVLKLTSNYTPEISDFIIAKVLRICENTSEMVLLIEVGESNLEAPKGKFSLEDNNTEENKKDSKIREMNWNELMEVRILFP